MYAPLVIFAFNRPEHLRQCIANVLQCAEAAQTDVYIFCDGAKEHASENELNAIALTQKLAAEASGFKSVQCSINEINRGLSNAVINGVTEVLRQHTHVIVLEDDIFVGTDFLRFMNQALKKYDTEMQVAGIAGYSFPIGETQPYFSRTGSCWGWATYQNVWNDFIMKRKELSLDVLHSNEMQLFNVYKDEYTAMFLLTKKGAIQSWAVEFYLYYFSQKQFFLLPGINLISNTGFDGSGAHKKNGNFLTDNNPIGTLPVINFPMQVKEEPKIRKKIEKLYRKGYAKPTFIRSFINKIKSLLLGNENNNH